MNSLPKACRTRERGARESHRLRCLECAPSRELAHAKRTSAYADHAAGRRQACSRPKPNVTLLQLRKIRSASTVVPTFFRSGARGLHVPTRLTREGAKHEAEAPGQRTSACRLLARVGPPVNLPLVQNCMKRSINAASRSWVVESPRSMRNVHSLRAQSENGLPKACATRERGARECRRLRCLERAPSHELAHATRTSTYEDHAAGRRQACSCAEPNVTLCCITENENASSVGPTALRFSRARSSARGCATRSVARNEARKRRASKRARVGC